MLKKELHHSGTYFDSYYIFDTEKGHYIGLIEDHNRKVKNRHFVGWRYKGNHFIPNTFQRGKTKMFYTFEEALEYIQEEA